ncbi:MAG: hypothetical protein QNJ54_29240 [Prochloraceae cyanobacterium]|nr:hypothetical protein [Prochloraceae cyanobacterium]
MRHSDRSDRNNQDWLFFTPTLGDNWSHLVENECWKDSENYAQSEEKELENKNQKPSLLEERSLILGVATSVLLVGAAICLQLPNQLKTNTNSIVTNNSSK